MMLSVSPSQILLCSIRCIQLAPFPMMLPQTDALTLWPMDASLLAGLVIYDAVIMCIDQASIIISVWTNRIWVREPFEPYVLFCGSNLIIGSANHFKWNSSPNTMEITANYMYQYNTNTIQYKYKTVYWTFCTLVQ